jgi:hypothetical protein
MAMFPDVTGAREHINGTGPRGGDGQQQVLELSTLRGFENVALAPSRQEFPAHALATDLS